VGEQRWADVSNDNVGVAAATSPTNYIDNEAIATGGSPATVDRQRVRIGGLGYTDLADVVAGDTGQSGQVVHGARKEVTFTTTTAQAVASTDCSNYRYVSVHITGQGSSSTVTWQCSNDNVNWVGFPLVLSSALVSNATSPVLSTTSTGMWTGVLPGRYFRLNITGISSGTTAGVVEMFAAPQIPSFLSGVTVLSGTSSVSTGNQGDNASESMNTNVKGFNGTSWDRLRVPTIFKTATATASGDTALWTPTSGKKFRLLRYKIEVTADAATSGGADIDIQLRDSTTGLAGAAMSLYVPGTSVTTTAGRISSGWVDLGNGQLSAAANNVLNINLSAALTSGKARVVAVGTEE
jgi:hypothetical protein